MWRVAFLTIGALVAFAANSILCRLALGAGEIDAASFTLIRLVSGAAILLLIVLAQRRQLSGGSLTSGAMLFAYAIAFSFAYLSLGAATGALILFSSVQLTMFAVGLAKGERPAGTTWLGWLIAFGGMVYLVLPGVRAPSPTGAGLMTLAGIAWGVYSLRGRRTTDATSATAHNFLLSVPMAVIASLLLTPHINLSGVGVAYALVSGALTSGLGYVLWYAALPKLSATRAALVQLSVPIIAAFGAVVFIGETLTSRHVIATCLTLGGLGIALLWALKPRARQ